MLADLDNAMEMLGRVQRNLKRYRASVLKAAVEGRLVPTEAALARAEGRDYEPASKLLERLVTERGKRWVQSGRTGSSGEAASPSASDLAELPVGWCWTTIGEAFDVVVGATPSRAEPKYWGGEIPWVSSGEVAFCRIRATRETITQAGLAGSSTKLNPPGTVLMGMIGEGRTRGQAAILDVAACNNQNAAAIRVSEAGLSPEFTYYYLAATYERNRGRGSGNNQPALNKARVQAIPLPMPPAAEQKRIAEALEGYLADMERTDRGLSAELRRLARLRQSILKWAFEGKLVDQDLNDEPASVLLESIRAERAAAAPVAKSRAKKPRVKVTR
jgi:type I restriction enzyme S subunit